MGHALAFDLFGAAGNVDLSFDPGSGVNGQVAAIALQPDGKMIIAGQFTTVQGFLRHKIARLNADGSGDSTFDSLPELSNPDWAVYSVALQPDGKALIGGAFIIGGFNSLARLNSDGSLDGDFNPSGLRSGSFPMVVQPDGKVLIGGAGISRLNANGTLDSTFDTNAAGFGSVACITLQPDGKVLVGGDGYLARRNANGTLDSSFNPGAGANSGIRTIVVQSDGKVLIGGSFTSVNGTDRHGIARLNADGSLDNSFDPKLNGLNPLVNCVVVQSEGKILIGGSFVLANATNQTCLARLNSDGTPDGAFNPSPGSEVNSIVAQLDGRVLAGGYFTIAGGASRNRIARFNADGAPDGSFDPGRGLENTFTKLVALSDGNVLAGGPLTFVNGPNQTGNLRLNANGSVDAAFSSDTNFNHGFGVRQYGNCGSEVCYNIAYPTAATALPDGKVVVGVSIDYWQCDPFDGGCVVSTRYSIFRLNADGISDSSFVFTNLVNNVAALGSVKAIAVEPNGKIVVGSAAFNTVRIARLNADGSWDNSFNPGAGPNGGVESVALQPDGKMLIGGNFSTFNGTIRKNLARLTSNGSLDDSFNPGSGLNGTIFSIALQSDGRVVVGGDFTAVNGENRNRIVRLNADGSLDSGFNSGTGPDGTVRSLALQSDGDILISGEFITVNGLVRPFVARLHGAGASPALSIAKSDAGMTLSWPSSAGFVLDQSFAATGVWSQVESAYTTNLNVISIREPVASENKFYRLRKL